MASRNSSEVSLIYPEYTYTARIDDITSKQNDKWGLQYTISATIIGPEEVPTPQGGLNPIGTHFRMTAFPNPTEDWAGPRWINFLRAIQVPQKPGTFTIEPDDSVSWDDELLPAHLIGLTFDIRTGSIKEYFAKNGDKYGVTDLKKASIDEKGQPILKGYVLKPGLEQAVGKGSRPRPVYLPALNKGHDVA